MITEKRKEVLEIHARVMEKFLLSSTNVKRNNVNIDNDDIHHDKDDDFQSAKSKEKEQKAGKRNDNKENKQAQQRARSKQHTLFDGGKPTNYAMIGNQ